MTHHEFLVTHLSLGDDSPMIFIRGCVVMKIIVESPHLCPKLLITISQTVFHISVCLQIPQLRHNTDWKIRYNPHVYMDKKNFVDRLIHTSLRELASRDISRLSVDQIPSDQPFFFMTCILSSGSFLYFVTKRIMFRRNTLSGESTRNLYSIKISTWKYPKYYYWIHILWFLIVIWIFYAIKLIQKVSRLCLYTMRVLKYYVKNTALFETWK